jgi:hypothetical protein
MQQLYEQEIDSLIADFNQTFPNSDLIKDKRQCLIDAISECFEKRRITEEHSQWIYGNLVAKIDIEFVPKIMVRKPKESFTDYMMRKWGEELGSLLLLFNRAITNIVRKFAQATEQKDD